MRKQVLKKKHIVILGAGLAGLATGYELTKAGHKVTLIEKEKEVGGLARTFEVNGFRFDTGPHRWYTKNDMVNGWMLQLLGREVIKVPRLTRIYFDKTFFHYPIKLKSTLLGMGLIKTSLAVFDYTLVKLISVFYKKEPVTLEDGFVAQFGWTLYRMFFKRYSEKLWGTSCTNISADWIGQRSRGFNIFTIIKDTFWKSKNVVSFVDEFSYPKRGIGRIAGKMAEEIKAGGGKILVGTEVVRLTHADDILTDVTVKNTSRRTLKADEVVSTIPLSDLIRALSPAVSTDIGRINDRLTYRDQVQIALFVRKTHITPDTWVYVHSLNLPYVRFMEMDNWSSELSPKGTTTLVFEVTCNEGDDTWKKSDQDLAHMVISSFTQEFRLITKADIIDYYVHRMPKEYPVYHIGYKADLAFLKEHLSHYTNLQIAGRNGIFRYNNMDHSIEMGLYAAWNIIEGERKFNIESVNIEREYLEVKKLKEKHIELPEDESVEKD